MGENVAIVGVSASPQLIFTRMRSVVFFFNRKQNRAEHGHSRLNSRKRKLSNVANESCEADPVSRINSPPNDTWNANL